MTLRKVHWYKIQLITMTDVQHFVHLAEQSGLNLKLCDNDKNYMVNASSLLGVRYSLEWDSLYLISEEDVYTIFKNYIVESTIRYQK